MKIIRKKRTDRLHYAYIVRTQSVSRISAKRTPERRGLENRDRSPKRDSFLKKGAFGTPMNGATIIAASSITAAWLALGGDEPTKFGRARAFYRDGNNQRSVSIHEAKGCWYDHRDNIGGGILDLIQHVMHCSRGAALRWLSDLTGVAFDDRPFNSSERRQYARRREQADQLARDVADFERGLELFLLRRRDQLAALTECLLSLDLEPGELLCRVVRQQRLLRDTDPDTLVAVYTGLPDSVRGRFLEEGQRDREGLEQITHVIVEILAMAIAEDSG